MASNETEQGQGRRLGDRGSSSRATSACATRTSRRERVVVPTRRRSPEVEDAADRNRARIRARFGFDATVTDNVKATLPLATGDGDPRSTNQTLDQHRVARKAIWPRPGLRRLEVHERRQPGARQAAVPVLAAGPEPVLRRRLQSGRRRGQVRPRHVLRQRLRLVAARRTTTPSPTGNNEDANIFGLQARPEVRAVRRRDAARGALLRVRRVPGQQPVLVSAATAPTATRRSRRARARRRSRC